MRPVKRIAPGVSDIRHITLCWSTVAEVGVRRPSVSICGRADVLVLDQVAGAVDGRDRGAGLGERRDDLVAGALADPAADEPVEQVGVLGAGVAGGEPRLVEHLGVTDQPSTRSAIACALVEIATQWPSLVS